MHADRPRSVRRRSFARARSSPGLLLLPWRRRRALALLLLAWACLARPSRPPPPVAGTPAALEVLDGDTLRLSDGRRVRLLSVDTPELGRPCADAARDFARAFVAGGELRLVPEQPRHDTYGRLLADVEVGGRSLSRALLAAGLAVLYEEDDPALVALQARAVDERRGQHARLHLARGPFLVTARRLHRPGCPWTRSGGGLADLCSDPAEALRVGRSPCRTCLAWPP